MADTEGLLSEVADEVISCKKDAVLGAVEKAKKVMEPAEIIDKGLSAGMNPVGILFERGKLFLPHVMMAADAMTTGAKVLEVELPAGTQSKKLGVDKMDLVDEHVMRELREKLDLGVITSVPGAAKSIAAKMNIEKLLDIKINSCDLFRRQIA